MSRKQSNKPTIDTLESRTMFSAAPTVVGYLPDYEANTAMVKQIDWTSITQLNYFSVVPGSNGAIPGADGKATATSMDGESLSQLKYAVSQAHAHHVKVDIVVGGAGAAPTAGIENVLTTSALRSAFAKSAAQFVKTYGLDGVDMDYEPAGPSDTQIANYGKLLATTRADLPTSKTLSAAVNPETLPNGNNWDDRRYILNAQAVKSLNQIGIMAYDFTPGAGNSGWDETFTDLTNWGTYVNSIQAGAKSKLLLGMPFYGKAGPSDWSSTAPSVDASYGDIMNAYAAAHNGQLPSPDSDQAAVALTYGAYAGQTVEYYYNGPTTIQAKTANALWDGAGGVMVWDLGQDYFVNGKYDNTYSLLPAVKRGVQEWAASNTTAAQTTSQAVFSETHIAAEH